MASKRKFEVNVVHNDQQAMHISNKKHTLDSDEEDSDDYEQDDINDSDIEGGEEGVASQQGDIQITPFNMREELEEGHFDKEGHYHWKKEADIKDNWLDNIDWVKVKTDKNHFEEDSLDASHSLQTFNETEAYQKILEFMKPTENVQKALQRLGKNRTKISTAERLRQKKLGIVDDAVEKIIKLTEITNETMKRTGNMDIYQESYEHIVLKLKNLPSTSKTFINSAHSKEIFDMYADDFEQKEKKHIDTTKSKNKNDVVPAETTCEQLKWEYKRTQGDTKIEGPFSTEQMLKWSKEKFFGEGIYVRKVGESSNFYSSKRIDFDLYL